MKSWQRIAGVFLLIVSAVVIQQSIFVLRLFDHGQPGSGFMPFGLGVVLAILSGLIIFTHLGPDEERVPFWPSRAWLRPFLGILIMGVYVIAFDDLGAVASVVILVMAWLLLLERKSILVAASTGLLTGLVVYLLFERLLMTPFPRGLLF
ncbi:MAG TPA: tripartite tricarboxylate transporter TctB family protein [Candidatus Methylomirabilis sp.]|nr:tripartite tricarboxylate transporter TctB family protein [Candidatus Methylomirabilis sp.]HSC71828.1 tripartite tricarboxylate transporter TctB family protein [Candidatus Methylomirabilis sp.]